MEDRLIAATDRPRTRESLAADLRRLGLPAGGVVLVHSSLSAMGWVCGGAVAVVQALLDVLGEAGTLVVPTQTMGNSDPATWSRPPVPEAWWPDIRAHLPAFDPAITRADGLGIVPETVRTWPGARRSDHPQVSFAAVGPQAERVTGVHALDCALGEASPLARLYELDAWVLLLGAGHASNTSFHLAEHRVPAPPREVLSAAVGGPGGRRWATWEDVATDSTDFGDLGAAFDATGRTTEGLVGSAHSRLLRQREGVDFAVGWLREHR